MKHYSFDAFGKAGTAPAPAEARNILPFNHPDSPPGITGQTVRSICELRRQRASMFPPKLLGDPTWDILLHLYVAHLEMTRIDITRLTKRTRLPATTVLRRLGVLADEGLLSRSPDRFDSRRVHVALSVDGVAAMERFFTTSGARAGLM